MTSIIVKSLPLKDVIRDIANALQVDYSENCQEYILQIPEEFGKGTIRGINFDSGLGIVQYDCQFNRTMELQFSVPEVHPLKFLYQMDGVLNHRFENSSEWTETTEYQTVIVASTHLNGHVLRFPKDKHIRMNSLEIDRERFESKITCEIKNIDAKLENLFKDKNADHRFYYHGTFSLNISDLFVMMDEFEETNFIRKLFLEGMSYQLLTQQILQYNDDSMEEGNQSILRLSELQQIRRIAEMIEKNISEVSTVEELALEAGFNENKLQAGFKYLYHNTVNGFVQKTRLDQASKLLDDPEISISEIVSLIGLNSKSYFSKIFKEKYGITPSEYRKNLSRRT